MLIPSTVAVEEFPARSVQLPSTDCPEPSIVSVLLGVREATPDRKSVQAKLAVTSTLFHPFAFASGDFEPERTGGVRSMLIGATAVGIELPALSTQVPVTDWPNPSPRVVGPETDAMPDRASEQLKLTVTGTLFQPFPSGGTDREPVMTGAVRSMLISLTVAEAEFPALS